MTNLEPTLSFVCRQFSTSIIPLCVAEGFFSYYFLARAALDRPLFLTWVLGVTSTTFDVSCAPESCVRPWHPDIIHTSLHRLTACVTAAPWLCSSS
ncbi:hypothetical protein DL93DRAFT_2091665, partial [Clavulina sp. PMI_390]